MPGTTYVAIAFGVAVFVVAHAIAEFLIGSTSVRPPIIPTSTNQRR